MFPRQSPRYSKQWERDRNGNFRITTGHWVAALRLVPIGLKIPLKRDLADQASGRFARKSDEGKGEGRRGGNCRLFRLLHLAVLWAAHGRALTDYVSSGGPIPLCAKCRELCCALDASSVVTRHAARLSQSSRLHS